ncbi:hypothetical protein SAMN05660652_00130 [Propionivibrio dicarboxylicus]|uniref:Uncharacterized protein n=1 Tax=Propionivibrio dicarboxylicus TaxID=83767 RepID=A0A1G7V9L2_9RHOO|nr:hypothetical protein SAMN05660652_00130 [Propionivibrio dicarboxylicus]
MPKPKTVKPLFKKSLSFGFRVSKVETNASERRPLCWEFRDHIDYDNLFREVESVKLANDLSFHPTTLCMLLEHRQAIRGYLKAPRSARQAEAKALVSHWDLVPRRSLVTASWSLAHCQPTGQLLWALHQH